MFDWPLAWQILLGCFTALAVICALAALFFRFKFRGVLHWNSSIAQERKTLEDELAVTTDVARKQAIQLVAGKFDSIKKSNSPGLGEIHGVVGFVRDIAACYHPSSAKPELCITSGRLLNCAREVGEHLQLVLSRRGFRRLREVRFRHLLQAKEGYDRFLGSGFARAVSKILQPLGPLLNMRFFIFPEPVSILAFLSNRLAILTATRSLLLDIYLFVGKLAIRAYDSGEPGARGMEPKEVEKGLEDLAGKRIEDFDLDDPALASLRDKLPGWRNLLEANPTLEELKEVVAKAAGVISSRHFPDSPAPMLEAKVGPVLERSQEWLQVLCETGKLPLARSLLNVRVEGFLGTKQAIETWMPKPVRIFMQEAMKLYGQLKWPVKVFRWAKKFSPQKVALDVGMHLAYKTATSLLCRRVFDSICIELEKVYRDSR